MSSPSRLFSPPKRVPWSLYQQIAVAGNPLGVPISKLEGRMAVKLRIADREFTLTWEEFDKVFYRATNCVELESLLETKEAVNS